MICELRGILLEQVERLLAAEAGPALLRGIEAGEFPAALWAEAAALGLPAALVPEAMGGAGLGFDDAVALWRLLGRHAAPLPLGETMLAGLLLAEHEMTLPEGVASFALPDMPVPWGRHAAVIVQGGGGGVGARGIRWIEGANMAGEPRDIAPIEASRDEPMLLGGALLRAAQVAGALEAVLAMTIEYANTRKQFGRPIGGFQAVQQMLAQAAGEVAAAGVAVAQAGAVATRRGLLGAGFEIAAAKVVCGEAAGRVAAIAHQVFAAIGFTREHHLHLYTRRLWAWRDECGGERFWAQRLGEAALEAGGAALWPGLTAR